jgi:hypothetical protein
MPYRQTFTAGQVLTAAQMNQLQESVWELDTTADTTTAYTLVLGDAGKYVTLSNAAGITLTIPTNATVAFDVGTVVNVVQLGAGQVTIAGAGGVTVNSEGSKLKLKGQYAVASLLKTATNTWVALGNLSA